MKVPFLYKESSKGACFGILCNLVLFVFKLAAGIIGNSRAMIADSLHTAGDSMSSVVVLAGFKLAQKPADAHHPFGHGRAESISAKLVAIGLMAVGVAVAVSAARAMAHSRVAVPGNIALFAALVSILVKEYAYRRVIRTSKMVGSTSLEADARHHRCDALSSAAAALGIAGARMGWLYMDAMAGIIVAGFMISSGAGSFHRAYDELMDAAPPESFKQEVTSIVKGVPGVVEVKKVMSRKAGIEMLLELTIAVNGELTVKEGHEVTINVEKAIKDSMSNVRDIIVHAEPA